MSVVHNYIILPSIDDWESVEAFNEWSGLINGFVNIAHHCGGTKYMEAEVWALAVNRNPDINEMVKIFMSYPWKNKLETIMLHKDQEADTWTNVQA